MFVLLYWCYIKSLIVISRGRRHPIQHPCLPLTSRPTDSQLYEQICEPVSAWQARDEDGHDRNVAYEKSVFRKILKLFC